MPREVEQLRKKEKSHPPLGTWLGEFGGECKSGKTGE